MSEKIKCNNCNQIANYPRSCFGNEFHALSHPNCSLLPEDIKNHICDYIIRSEKRMSRNDEGSLLVNLEELNELRLELNNEKSFSANSLNSPKTNSNAGIIIAIVMFAAFSIIGLGYLT